MLQIIDDKALSTETTEDKKKQDISTSSARVVSSKVGKYIKNLSTIANLTRSKSLKLTKSKKLDLLRANFTKVNFSKTDFLTLEANKAFLHLQKTFTKALIFRSEYHIWIETDILGYAIGGILSQMTLDQYFSSYVTHEDPNSSNLKLANST